MPNFIANGRGYAARDQAPSLVRLEFSFAPNGASAIDPAGNRGAGAKTSATADGLWSVARTGTGTYTVTLRDSFLDYDSVIASLQLTAATAMYPQVGDLSVVNRTFVVRVINASGAAVDVAAGANNRVHIAVTLRCTDRKN
jgi:hypothetical protein